MASNFSIRHAAHIIRHGGIIAYPTDTIYGLGCDPYNADAVEKINLIKQRPLNKQFILLAGHIDQIRPLINISKKQEILITQNTEPTSWVIKASPHTPAWLTDNTGAITVRISKHIFVQRLCQMLGHAIISTSANPSGKKPAENNLDLHKYFHHTVDKILATNERLTARPSTVIRLSDTHVIRQ